MLDLSPVDASWQPMLKQALTALPDNYSQLLQQEDWLPGPRNLFNAFSLPLSKVRYILFGESPYPRAESANGFAFWDAAVGDLWSAKGLSKTVNRATSLRNIMKMLLVADGKLDTVTDQAAIATVDKSAYVTTLAELFANLQSHGFLLLNASLTLSAQGANRDAKAWFPVMQQLLTQLADQQQSIRLVLFGKIAEKICAIPASNQFEKVMAEHPYNISFIHNSVVLDFFRPLQLLRKPQ